jgi:cytochrome P450
MVDRPWKYVKDGLLDGSAAPSVSAVLLEGLPEGEARAEKEQIAKNCAGVAFVGGADTTASAAQTFFLAMAMFPEVQKKAQAELDAVIGGERLPDFNDYDSLSYINAS